VIEERGGTFYDGCLVETMEMRRIGSEEREKFSWEVL